MAPLPADGEGPLCKGNKEPSALPEQTGLRVLWAVWMASIAVQKYTRKHKWTMRLLWDARPLKRGTKKGSSKIYTKVEGGLSGSRQALDSQRLAQRRCNRPCTDQPLQPLHPNKCLLRGCQSGTSLAKPWKMAIK